MLNYPLIIEDMLAAPAMELSYLRFMLLNDLWFLIKFAKQVPDYIVGHKFWVDRCRDIQDGPKDYTLDLWAREHGKSTIITTGESIFDLLHNPEETTCILSYNRATALTFLKEIKFLLESSDLLQSCFPEILYRYPEKESQQWALENGLLVKRKGNQKEMTFEAYGLIDGMPTGRHFTKRYYDDIVTHDLVGTPQSMVKVKQAFDMSHNLGTYDGTHRVIGTYYHYEDPLVYLTNKKIEEDGGTPVYKIRKYPATKDGAMFGESVYLPEERLKKLRVDKNTFATQMLLEPNPIELRKLHGDFLKVIKRSELPQRLYKFILVDPAGSSVRTKARGDDWAIFCIGVSPYRGDFGLSDIYILDGIVSEMSLTDAQNAVVDIYERNGKIRAIGVEKVGLSSAEIHITNALRAKGKMVSEERGNLILVGPKGREKKSRIETALSYPLDNGRVHVVAGDVSADVITRIKQELDKFPYWRDDATDAISYIYDLLKEYKFPLYHQGDPTNTNRDTYDFNFDEDDKTNFGWMGR
jgi:hypothetical protein